MTKASSPLIADAQAQARRQRPLGVVIVGAGSIGRLTRDVLTAMDGVEVVDVLPGRAVSGISLSRSDVDVVAVCSANGLHVEHAQFAVGAGKDVVVEKPLTLDVESGQRLLASAATRGVSVSVISQRRYEPFIVATKAAVKSGVLGRPILAECLLRWRRDGSYFAASPWRGTRELDGGVLFNQGVHVIDLMRWLMGPVATVSAHQATRIWDIAAPDTATASLRFASGALGVVSATVGSSSPSPAELNLYFEHGTIRLHDDRLVEWSVPGIPFPQEELAVGSGSQDPTAIGQLGHRRQWEHIVSTLRSGRQPDVAGIDALGTAALVAAMHVAAAQDGRPVSPAVP
jgi:UDP-N-acetyl-2-amino-2-deoxyglucuronate dehydrogenase